MKDVLSIKQYQKLRFALIWHADWQEALKINPQGMTHQDMADHKEMMQWFAYKAVKECEDAGLNPEFLYNQTLMVHAWEYENEALPSRLERPRKELKAEGII